MHVRFLQREREGTLQLLLMPLSTAPSIKSSRAGGADDEEECDAVPLPIQTFLWRQTNPFLGAKIGKLHEASCVCCGALLKANAGQRQLSTSLQKILYILHWMILDSASECLEGEIKLDSLEAGESGGESVDGEGRRLSATLFPISSIQLFVYLLAPLAHIITEEQITGSIRLERGLKIWSALWKAKTPDVECFAAPVKERRDSAYFHSTLRLLRPPVTNINGGTGNLTEKKTAATRVGVTRLDVAGIYLGDEVSSGPRRPSILPPPKPPRTDAAVLEEKRKKDELEELRKKKEKEAPPPHLLKVASVVVAPPPLAPPPLAPPPLAPPPLAPPPHDPLSPPPVRPLVRSVSDYRSQEDAETLRLKMIKSRTISNAMDSTSPTSESWVAASSRALMEMECGVSTACAEGQNALVSPVFAQPEDAPLASLSEICNSDEGIPIVIANTSTEVHCEECGEVLMKNGEKSSSCSCFAANISKKKSVDGEAKKEIVSTSHAVESESNSSQQTVLVPGSFFPNAAPRFFDSAVQFVSSNLTCKSARDDCEAMGLGIQSELPAEIEVDVQATTYLDVAVLRALLTSFWSEGGVSWALSFILNRLTHIQQSRRSQRWWTGEKEELNKKISRQSTASVGESSVAAGQTGEVAGGGGSVDSASCQSAAASSTGTHLPPPPRPTQNHEDDDDDFFINNMPWLKVLMRMSEWWDTECRHEECSTRCFSRMQRMCGRLSEALSFIHDRKRSEKRVDKRRLLQDKWKSEQLAFR